MLTAEKVRCSPARLCIRPDVLGPVEFDGHRQGFNLIQKIKEWPYGGDGQETVGVPVAASASNGRHTVRQTPLRIPIVTRITPLTKAWLWKAPFRT